MSRTLAPPSGLVEGMRMDWPEFETRWLELPELKRAELIDGVVHMPSPLSFRHARPDARITGWLFLYCVHTPGVRQAANPTLVLDANNAPQPDAILQIGEGEVGMALGATGLPYVTTPIELVVETSVTSVTRDTITKRELYQRFGVREYLNWRVFEGAVDWFAWRPEGYAALAPDSAGVVRSEAFPGLWLDTRALLADAPAALAAAVDAGCATAEHAAFVERLRAG